MPKSTMVHLVEELEQLNTDGRYDHLIRSARAGDYHDCSTSHLMAKVELINDLNPHPELDGIARDVILGVYNESEARDYTEPVREVPLRKLWPTLNMRQDGQE